MAHSKHRDLCKKQHNLSFPYGTHYNMVVTATASSGYTLQLGLYCYTMNIFLLAAAPSVCKEYMLIYIRHYCYSSCFMQGPFLRS